MSMKRATELDGEMNSSDRLRPEDWTVPSTAQVVARQGWGVREGDNARVVLRVRA